jgi:hypothetical protein
MTPGGWINLILSLSIVLGLFGFCVWKLLHGAKPPEKEHLAHIEPIHDDQLDQR